MPRDRLAQSKILDSAPHEIPLLDRDGNSHAMRTLPVGGVSMEDFLLQVDEVKGLIYNYRASISVLSQLHAQHLRATEAAAQGVASEIASRRRETAALGNDVRMRLATMNTQNKKTHLPGDEFDVRKTHLVGIQRSFGGVLTEYNLVEKEAMDNCRALAERQYRIVKPDASQGELDAVLGDSRRGTAIFGQALISSRQSGARSAFADAQVRNAELATINETIVELAGLMNDLATLVFEQDDATKDIEANAVATERDMKTGLVQLSKARQLAAAARKMRWWCFGLFSVILLIVLARS